jgi:tRNA(fMet)-specific endonuclease VapC
LGPGVGRASPARRGRGAALTRLLLDTTFLIDAERSGVDLDGLIADEDDVAIAAITVAELRVGVELSEGQKRVQRQAFVDDVVETVPILPYDLDVALAHAELLVAVRRQGLPRGAHDLIIAATAKASSRTVVTADTGAFKDLPDVPVRGHR